MLFDDHKKITTIILAKRNKQGDRQGTPVEMKPELQKTEDGELDGRHAAMQDFMMAHKEGSASGMADAMKNFIDIHHSLNMRESE